MIITKMRNLFVYVYLLLELSQIYVTSHVFAYEIFKGNLLVKEIPSKIDWKKYIENDKKKVLFNDPINRMVEMHFDMNKDAKISNCRLYGNGESAIELMGKRKGHSIIKAITIEEMRKIIDTCSEFLLDQISKGHRTSPPTGDLPPEYDNDIDRSFFDGLTIYPGTKWCGSGNIAEDYEDLGNQINTDQCCREHDHCFDYIPKGKKKYNLTNKAIHTKSHCECDTTFSKCLGSNKNGISNRIGSLYFNVIQSQCFKEDHPIIKCLEYKGIPWFWQSCQLYELDLNKEKMYQFFDAKYYNRE